MDEKEKEELLKRIEEYTKKIEEEPKNASYWNNRGVTYHNLKEYEKAIEDYNKAIELNPNYSLAYNNRGNTFSILKEYEKERSIAVKIDLYKCLRNFVQESTSLKKYEKIKFAEDIYSNASKDTINLIVDYIINLVKKNKNLKI